VSLDEGAKIAAVVTPPASYLTVIVQPIRSARGAIGVAIVPDWHVRPAALNGIPLRAGLHLLHESDCLEVGATRYFVSAEVTAEDTFYDPAVHGEDIYCALTKARLVAGQPITICPGTPSARCGVLYKAEAWDLAMRQSKPSMQCTNCGYSTSAAEWVPPARKTRKKLDELYRRIHATAH
jgi:hypothetical protein